MSGTTVAVTIRDNDTLTRLRIALLGIPGAEMAATGGYTDRAGIDARANSALGTIEAIITDHAIPSAVRLVLVAERMAAEPILTDTGSPAAYEVREQARPYPRNFWTPVQR